MTTLTDTRSTAVRIPGRPVAPIGSLEMRSSARHLRRESGHSGSSMLHQALSFAHDRSELAGRLAGERYWLEGIDITDAPSPDVSRISRAKPYQLVAPAAVR